MAEYCKSLQELSVEQQNAIDLLVLGRSDREVAEAVGVSRQTVTAWRNNNSLFAAELNVRRQELWGNQTDKIVSSLLPKALQVLEEDLNNTEDLRLRQAAAVQVLRAVGFGSTSLKPEGLTDAKKIEREKVLAEVFP
jgi:transposase